MQIEDFSFPRRVSDTNRPPWKDSSRPAAGFCDVCTTPVATAPDPGHHRPRRLRPPVITSRLGVVAGQTLPNRARRQCVRDTSSRVAADMLRIAARPASDRCYRILRCEHHTRPSTAPAAPATRAPSVVETAHTTALVTSVLPSTRSRAWWCAQASAYHDEPCHEAAGSWANKAPIDRRP
eukprot:scaffold57364_cov54-Phaeocystis_antarctica.AAC.3